MPSFVAASVKAPGPTFTYAAFEQQVKCAGPRHSVETAPVSPLDQIPQARSPQSSRVPCQWRLAPLSFHASANTFWRGWRKRALVLLMAISLGFSPFFGLAPECLGARLEKPLPPVSQDDAPPSPPLASRQVTDCVLHREPRADNSGGADISITYPAFGNPTVDADIRQYVNGLADGFAKSTFFGGYAWDAADEGVPALRGEPAFELRGDYSITRPSEKALSIAFELWNYVGGQGNMDVLTLNYNLLTGQRLELVDIFEKPEVALELMSKYSRKVLGPRLGASRRMAMFNGGTAPVVENFSSLTLTPDGVCINFQPWQVAPQDAGAQKVMMPLEELLPSAPLLALWGR